MATTILRTSPSSPRFASANVLPSRPSLKTVDLRSLEYVSPYDDNLMCPVCHSPFVGPVELECEHFFCLGCIGEALHHQQTDKKSCPICRKELGPNLYSFAPKVLYRILDDLKVKCPMSCDGCLHQGRRSDIQIHLDKYCLYREAVCPSKICSLRILRKDSLDGKCHHCLVQCESCDELFMELDIEFHRSTNCNFANLLCPHYRGTLAPHGLKLHLVACPRVVVCCSAAAIGCDFKGPRSTLEEHTMRCPLAKLLPFFEKQSRRLDDQGRHIRELR